MESQRSEKERCDEIVVNILLVPIFENMLLASNLKYSPFQHLMRTMCAIKLKALQNSGEVIYVLHTCVKKTNKSKNVDKDECLKHKHGKGSYILLYFITKKQNLMNWWIIFSNTVRDREKGDHTNFRWVSKAFNRARWDILFKFIPSWWEGILFVYNSLLCAALSDKGKVWLRCNRVKVINMCHRTVTFGIHSTATTKETENSAKTHGGLPLGGFCFLCHVSCSPWTLGQCQLSVSGWEEEC